MISAKHPLGSSWSRADGFTLVEVLVALSILSMLSLISFRGINALMSAEIRLSENATRLRSIERLFSEFENEVQFALPRPAWGSGSAIEPAVSARGSASAGYRVSFSHASGVPETPPYRVTYFFSPSRVELTVHDQLDSVNVGGSAPVTVLEGLNGVGMRFLATNDQWSDQWPPSGSPANALPRAVELTLNIEGLGSVTRLVARP